MQRRASPARDHEAPATPARPPPAPPRAPRATSRPTASIARCGPRTLPAASTVASVTCASSPVRSVHARSHPPGTGTTSTSPLTVAASRWPRVRSPGVPSASRRIHDSEPAPSLSSAAGVTSASPTPSPARTAAHPRDAARHAHGNAARLAVGVERRREDVRLSARRLLRPEAHRPARAGDEVRPLNVVARSLDVDGHAALRAVRRESDDRQRLAAVEQRAPGDQPSAVLASRRANEERRRLLRDRRHDLGSFSGAPSAPVGTTTSSCPPPRSAATIHAMMPSVGGARREGTDGLSFDRADQVRPRRGRQASASRAPGSRGSSTGPYDDARRVRALGRSVLAAAARDAGGEHRHQARSSRRSCVAQIRDLDRRRVRGLDVEAGAARRHLGEAHLLVEVGRRAAELDVHVARAGARSLELRRARIPSRRAACTARWPSRTPRPENVTPRAAGARSAGTSMCTVGSPHAHSRAARIRAARHRCRRQRHALPSSRARPAASSLIARRHR